MVTIAPGETSKNNHKTLKDATQSSLVRNSTCVDERGTNIQHLLKKPSWFTAAEIFSLQNTRDKEQQATSSLLFQLTDQLYQAIYVNLQNDWL